jgi:hypothetical protein
VRDLRSSVTRIWGVGGERVLEAIVCVVGSGERSDEGASAMMKCEARLRSCFVGAPHQALAGRRCDWLLIHHMLGVALSSPSDVPRQESRETNTFHFKEDTVFAHRIFLAFCSSR